MPSKRLTGFLRNLRAESTDVESRLRQLLCARRIQDFKFRRQQPIGPYTVDFTCFDAKLIIELDGGRHAEAQEPDLLRDGWLQNEGYPVLRIWTKEMLENETVVMEKILQMLTLSPGHSPVKGEGTRP
jgi:very-short-patch-repair endonuclease